jgi:hypothetical protein
MRLTDPHLQSVAVEPVAASTTRAAGTIVVGEQRDPTDGAETLRDVCKGLPEGVLGGQLAFPPFKKSC